MKICKQCGREINISTVYCPYCGAECLNMETEHRKFSVKKLHDVEKAVYLARTVVFIAIAICLFEAVAAFMGFKIHNTSKKSMEKLLGFTTFSTYSDAFIFTKKWSPSDSLSDWEIWYIYEDTVMVKIEDDALYIDFAFFFGTDFLSEGSCFKYYPTIDTVEIPCDYETDKGRLTAICYDIGDDAIYMVIDGDTYTSDEFVEYIRECDVPQVINDDIDIFKNQLQENGMTLREILDIGYWDLFYNREMLYGGINR